MKSKSIYLMYNKTPFIRLSFQPTLIEKREKSYDVYQLFISCFFRETNVILFFSCKYSLIQTKNSFERRTKLRGIKNQSFLNYYYYCSAPLPTTLLQHWTEQAKSIFNHFPILLRNHFVFWKKKILRTVLFWFFFNF